MEAFRAMGWGGSERAFIEATQDLSLADVPPRPRSVASGTDGEWHMVSPNGSDKAPSVCRSPRSSIDAGNTSDRRSSCSDTAGQNDILAERILGQAMEGPLGSRTGSMNSLADAAQRFAEGAEAVLMASAVSGTSEAAEGGSMQLLPYPLAPGERDDLDALRSADWGSQEGSVDGLEEAADEQPADAAGGPTAANRAPAAVQMEAAAVGGLGGFELLFADLADGVKGAGTAVAAGVLGVQAWLSSGMQLLIKAAQVGGDSVAQAVHTLVSSLPLVATKAGSLAWTRVLTSAAMAALVGAVLVAYKDNRRLRDMVARRDHELSKLVMRVVSLQELLHQQRQLPITRYHSPIATAAPCL